MERSHGTSERISGIVDGQILPVSELPLLTSNDTAWSGFLLEEHSSSCVRTDVSWGWHQTHVVLFTRGSLSFRTRIAGSDQVFVATSGSVCVFPEGMVETRFSIADSDFEATCVELNPASVAALLGSKARNAIARVAPQIVIQDASLTNLLINMRSEVVAGCPAGNLYGQSLSLGLAAYLEGRFSVAKTRFKAQRTLSSAQSQKLSDYVNANVGNAISLFELADIVQLSPRQFCRAFCNTFGTTPHQYVISQRVERAKELLCHGLTLVEIAACLGFSSQSHFSGVFRKAVGVSPGQYRRERAAAGAAFIFLPGNKSGQRSQV
jgi:AraC family transcriptional regulator